MESHIVHLFLPAMSCDNTWNIVYQGKFTRDQVLRVLTVGWSCRHHLPDLYQNSRLPEGMHVFSIDNIACTVSHFINSGNEGTLLKSQFQVPSKGSICKQTFLREQAQMCLCCHTHSLFLFSLTRSWLIIFIFRTNLCFVDLYWVLLFYFINFCFLEFHSFYLFWVGLFYSSFS